MDGPASPFAIARTIRDIGSYLPVDLGGEPYTREEHGRAAEAWLERSQAPLPAAVESPGYFNNWMADLQILALDIGSAHVRVTVDVDDAQDFASALGEVLGREVPRRTWPVDLLMHGVSYVRAAAHDSHGTLLDVAVESQSTSEPQGIGALLNEWFYAHGDRLGWVAETYGLASSSPSPTVHLLVDCERASVADRRLATLVDEFGPAVAPLWREARADLVEGGRPRAFWLPDDLADYLAPRLAAKGLKASDFRS